MAVTGSIECWLPGNQPSAQGGQFIAMSALACHIPAIAALVALPTLERHQLVLLVRLVHGCGPMWPISCVNARPDGEMQKASRLLLSEAQSRCHLRQKAEARGFYGV